MKRNLVPGGIETPFEDLMASNFPRLALEKIEGPNHLEMVASVMPFQLDQVIAIVEPWSQLSRQRARGPNHASLEYAEKFLTEYFAAIDLILKAEKIRVLVRSTSVPHRLFKEILCWQYRREPTLHEHCIESMIRIYSREFEKLFKSNPQVAFIFSSGNTSQKLSEQDDLDFQAFSQPNVLKVAALNASGDGLESYSTWHPRWIGMAADGTLSFDGKLYSGSSFAAPRVAARVDALMAEQNHLTGAQAIDFVRVNVASSVPSLLKKIFEGRALNGGCESRL